jgi:hypothetical protein
MHDLVALLKASLPEAIGGLLVAAIIALCVTLWTRFSKQRGMVAQPVSITKPTISMNSELLAKFNLARNQVIATVHGDYALELDNNLRTALDELNRQRRNQRLQKYFASTRYRMISYPRIINNSKVELNLVPINFAYVALLMNSDGDKFMKDYIEKKMTEVRERLPKSLRSDHPYFNGCNYMPLGIEIVLITKDEKTLLRRRGASVLEAPRKWDVSVSGYCGNIDVIDTNFLDFGLTVEHEVKREIGILAGDPREIKFTGIHRNKANGANEILGFWMIEETADSLKRLLAEKPEESFVWDATNRLVDFNGPDIARALGENALSNFVPEALTCLLLALESLGRSTKGLVI